MEVRFSISKAQYGRLLEDESAIVGRAIEMKWTVGQRDLIFDAYISRVGAEITSNTGGVNIFANIELDNDQETPLRPGAFVRLRMPDKTYKSVISIPETAVYEDEYIYIIKDQRLKKAVIVISDMISQMFYSTGRGAHDSKWRPNRSKPTQRSR